MSDQDTEFIKYRELLLSEIKRLNDQLIIQDSRLRDIQIEIAMLKIKSATWAGFAAFLVSTAVSSVLVLVQVFMR